MKEYKSFFVGITAGIIFWTVLLLLSTSAKGQVIPTPPTYHKVGDTIQVYGACLGELAALELTEAAAFRGHVGYGEVMHDNNIQCLDTKIHNLGFPVFIVTLVKREWQVRLPDGMVFQFWRGTAADGKIFVWLRVWERQL